MNKVSVSVLHSLPIIPVNFPSFSELDAFYKSKVEIFQNFYCSDLPGSTTAVISDTILRVMCSYCTSQKRRTYTW